MRLALSLSALILLGACDEQRLTDLEGRLAELEERLEAVEARPAGNQGEPEMSPHEQAAFEKWQELMSDYQAGKIDKVLEHIKVIETDFADTPALQAIQDIKAELSVIGSEPPPLETKKWFTGSATGYGDSKVTMVVFWELWCPHCRREVPKLEETYNKYKGQGLNVIGLTQMSRDPAEDEVTGFLSENNVTYPTALIGPGPAEAFKVSGIPAAALVKDGKIIWRGHPGMLSDDDLKGHLGS